MTPEAEEGRRTEAADERHVAGRESMSGARPALIGPMPCKACRQPVLFLRNEIPGLREKRDQPKYYRWEVMERLGTRLLEHRCAA